MPGALDGNSVYQYAEDDTASTFSGHMAKLTGPLSTKVGAIVTAASAQAATVAALGTWQAYTLTIPNASGSSNTATGAYFRLGDTVFVMGTFVFGAGGAMGGAMNITMPTNILDFAGSNPPANGVVELWDNSAASRRTDFYMRRIGSSAMQVTSSAGTAVAASSPWTWAPSDTVKFSISYRAA